MVPEREFSGADWCARFPGSNSTDDLEGDFKTGVNSFICAMKQGGADVSVAATYRPPERAYLMHWSWMIANGKSEAADVSAKAGVNINWDHGNDEASKAAAKAMVAEYGMSGLKVAPALRSRHTERKAIDMTISWKKELVIAGADGSHVTIKTEPRTGMNEDLHAVGAGYGVIKFWKGDADKPHWSTDGR
ncbi:peptidoglycan-binding domain-containing protein [Dechloromonas denitrificans]|uniref:Peptidoglycan-binding domain-containing protein n=1 Tax=Dechloromonas denitrificans TaxID=281362 RepID=A0A133XG47_9RHOO|nr:peptidoglycan-binding domain-containing protein [Dechloromonas denitrificans]